MQQMVNNSMKRGTMTAVFACMLFAATFATPAAETLSVSTSQVSSTKVAVEVRNDTDSDFSGVVDVRVVVSGVSISVPVNVELSAGESTTVIVDLTRLLLPFGPLSVILDGPTPF